MPSLGVRSPLIYCFVIEMTLLDSLHLQLRLRIYFSATNKSIFTHLIQLQDPNICVVLTENLIYSLYVS